MDIFKAAEMRQAGISFREIGAAVGKSHEWARQLLKRFGVATGQRICQCGEPAKQWQVGQSSRCQSCIDAWRIRRCKCGRTMSSKAKLCRSCHSKGREQFDRSEAAKLYTAGFACEAIAEHYGVTTMSVYLAIRGRVTMRNKGTGGRRDMTVAEWLEANP